MISCTEFIPSYSELFTFLENKYGSAEVRRFWSYLFQLEKADGSRSPLLNYVEKEGIRGCYSYWMGTLNEEAADFTMYLNEKAGWYMDVMHHCPSKGRLLELKEKIGVEPYHDYCLHCDYYRAAVEKFGYKYIYNFNGVDKAQCSMMIYDPKVFDGRIIIDENTVIVDRRASDNEYFHRGFHSSLNMGVDYLGTNYGDQDVEEYLAMYTKDVYAPLIKDVKARGLAALEEKIRDTYAIEKSEDALELKREGEKMDVTIKYCPAVKFLTGTGHRISKWYPETTRVVMQTIADETGYRFSMPEYDEATGAAKYSFTK
jgi:hypothetical protein